MGSDSWLSFYEGNRGRVPRSPFLDAISLLEQRSYAPGVAADIGSGDGVEARALLERGWHVIAIDREPEFVAFVRAHLSEDDASRIEFQVTDFESMRLPTVDFVWAGMSLFFCPPDQFGTVWNSVVSAIRAGGCFAGHFLGPNDSWAGGGLTVHGAEHVRRLLSDFEIPCFDEREWDGGSGSGPKHWHLFGVVGFKKRL